MGVVETKENIKEVLLEERIGDEKFCISCLRHFLLVIILIIIIVINFHEIRLTVIDEKTFLKMNWSYIILDEA